MFIFVTYNNLLMLCINSEVFFRSFHSCFLVPLFAYVLRVSFLRKRWRDLMHAKIITNNHTDFGFSILGTAIFARELKKAHGLIRKSRDKSNLAHYYRGKNAQKMHFNTKIYYFRCFAHCFMKLCCIIP